MKKIVFFIIIFFIFSANAYAEEPKDEIISSIENEITDFESTLPDYVKDMLPDEIFSGDFSSLINGDISYKTIWNSMINSVLAGIPSALNAVSLILVSVIISSVFNTLSSGSNTIAVKESYNFCSSLCISISVFNLVSNISVNAMTYMKMLCTVMT